MAYVNRVKSSGRAPEPPAPPLFSNPGSAPGSYCLLALQGGILDIRSHIYAKWTYCCNYNEPHVYILRFETSLLMFMSFVSCVTPTCLSDSLWLWFQYSVRVAEPKVTTGCAGPTTLYLLDANGADIKLSLIGLPGGGGGASKLYCKNTFDVRPSYLAYSQVEDLMLYDRNHDVRSNNQVCVGGGGGRMSSQHYKRVMFP